MHGAHDDDVVRSFFRYEVSRRSSQPTHHQIPRLSDLLDVVYARFREAVPSPEGRVDISNLILEANKIFIV